jgi:uncharacterized membrane protein YbhN (UPF0104 family)
MVRIATAAFVVVALVFFVLAIVSAWNATGGRLPSLWRLSAASALWAGGALAAATAWAVLLGGDDRIHHGAGFLVAQLGKYAPGGIVQATTQVGLARSAGIPVSRGVTAFTVLAMTQVVAGGTWALLLAASWTDASLALRLLVAAAGLALLVLINRRWMVWTLRRIPRTRESSENLIPTQRAIVRAWAAGLLLVGAIGLAYLLLLDGVANVDNPWLVVAAFAVAWTVGFAAVPIPAGVGVREAVLLALLHGMFPASVIVAASVYLRIAQIIAEGLLAAIASHRLRPARRRVAEPRDHSSPPSASR